MRIGVSALYFAKVFEGEFEATKVGVVVVGYGVGNVKGVSGEELGFRKTLGGAPGHRFVAARALRRGRELEADMLFLDESGRSIEFYTFGDEDGFGIAEAEGFEAL